jgi:putative phosphoesterase
MKALCFSDSHGNSAAFRRALNLHPDAEIVFFLGDGLSDIEPYIVDKTKAFFAVRGNCDGYSTFGDTLPKKTDAINIDGYRIVFTHGDLYGVKYGMDGLKKLASDSSADLVLFGHTHIPHESYNPTDDGGFYLFNPGSLSGGFDHKPSYGVINITSAGILLSHGTL